MSEAILNVPAHIAERIAQRKATGATSELFKAIISGESYPRISTKASRFRLVEGGVETVVGITLDVIIVGANPAVSRSFYSKAYDGSDGVMPDCASDDGVRPNADAAAPQCETCAACPKNVLGSKITPSGAKAKLCGEHRHLAVVAAADPTKVYGIGIPVTSMKGLREYFRHLQNYGVNPEEVVTELGFDDEATYPRVTFKLKNYVSEKALPLLEQFMTSEEVKVVTRQVASAGPALAAPKTSVALEAPKQEAAPAEAKAAPAAEPAAEPAPVQEKPKAAVASTATELESKLDALFNG